MKWSIKTLKEDGIKCKAKKSADKMQEIKVNWKNCISYENAGVNALSWISYLNSAKKLKKKKKKNQENTNFKMNLKNWIIFEHSITKQKVSADCIE